jgi:hypothetical protein
MVVASFDMNERERFAFRNCIAEIVKGNLFGIPTTLGTRDRILNVIRCYRSQQVVLSNVEPGWVSGWLGSEPYSLR